MRIAFEDTDRPAQVAHALRRQLAQMGTRLPAAASRDLVGRMFGYADWSDLKRAPRAASLPDHLVPEDERRTRHGQYVAALVGYGLDAETAARAVAAVAPNGRPDADVLDGLDFLADPPRLAPWLGGLDAAAFAARPGGERLIRAMQAAAADDPFWGLRGAHRLRVPGHHWIVGAMDALRAAPDHPAWSGLALICACLAAMTMADDHAHAGPLGMLLLGAAAEDGAEAAAAVLEGAPPEAVLSLVAHMEDLASSQFARLTPHVESLVALSLDVPSERLPWRPASPFDLRRPGSEPRLWSLDDIRAFGFAPAAGPVEAEVRTVDANGRDTGIGWAPADGPLARDEVILVGPPGGEPVLAAAVRVRADLAGGAFRIDVEGPTRIPDDPPGPEWEGCLDFLQAALLARLDRDLRSWSRVIPPGGCLRVLVSPGDDGRGGDFARDLARTLGERHHNMQRMLADLGFELVAVTADRSGEPRPLPPLHAVAVPEAARARWAAFAGIRERLAAAGHANLLCQFVGRELVVADGDGEVLAGRDPEVDAAAADLAGETCRAAVRAILAEAALGDDAYLLLGEGLVAALSARGLADREWSVSREVCLVFDAPPSEGERARALALFWAAFAAELDAIHAARAAAPAGVRILHAGTATRQ